LFTQRTQPVSKNAKVELSAFDFHVNPGRMTQEHRTPIPVHRRFHKVTKILTGDVGPVRFFGTCRLTVLGYPIFDMLPFVLIDNAIKHSPKSTNVDISFVDETQRLSIAVKSLGPMVSNDELPRLTDLGFRGKHARVASDGDGIGLALAKDICGVHYISMTFETSDEVTEIKGIPYAYFTVHLHFDPGTLSVDRTPEP